MTIKLIAIYRFLNCNHNEGPIKNIVRSVARYPWFPKCRSRTPQIKGVGVVRMGGQGQLCRVCLSGYSHTHTQRPHTHVGCSLPAAGCSREIRVLSCIQNKFQRPQRRLCVYVTRHASRGNSFACLAHLRSGLISLSRLCCRRGTSSSVFLMCELSQRINSN